RLSGVGDVARQPMAGDGMPLAFLLRVAVCRQRVGLHAAGCLGRASSQASSAVTEGSAADRLLDPGAPAAAFPEGRGSKALQCPAKAPLSGGVGFVVSVDRPRRARDVTATRRRLPLAALAF